MRIHWNGLFTQPVPIQRYSPIFSVFLTALSLVALWPAQPEACSRLLWNSDGDQVIVGRTLDWYHPIKSTLYIMPRGLQVSGGTAKNPMIWKIKYGSLTNTIATKTPPPGKHFMANSAMEGLNEKGLAGHFLFLTGSKYEQRDISRPGVSTFHWVRYLLDNFATVQEAVDGMNAVQIVPSEFEGEAMDLHVAIEDKSGDSAIIEFIDGKQTIYHGRNHTVLTNNPSYKEQLKRLAQYCPFGGLKALPGSVESTDRFVRLRYFSKYLPKTTNSKMAVATMLSAMRTVATPFGAPYSSGGIYPTWFISVMDLNNLTYHFDWVENISRISVDLTTLDFSEGSGARWLDPRRSDLIGNVNKLFVPIDSPHN